jgi:hypothetical protein
MSEFTTQLALSEKAAALVAESQQYELQVKEIKIESADQRANAVNYGIKINKLGKDLEAERASQTKPILDAKSQIDDLYKPVIAACETMVKKLKSAVGAYDAEERRKAAEEQERLRKEAEEKARKERERIQKLAEKQLEDGNKKSVALSAELGQLQQKLIEVKQEAQRLSQSGQQVSDDLLVDLVNLPKLIEMKKAQVQDIQETTLEKVETTLERVEEIQVFTPVVTPQIVKQKGESTRKVAKFEVTDFKALPNEYKLPNETKIRQVVNALKMDANIPGVRVWEEEQQAWGR